MRGREGEMEESGGIERIREDERGRLVSVR